MGVIFRVALKEDKSIIREVFDVKQTAIGAEFLMHNQDTGWGYAEADLFEPYFYSFSESEGNVDVLGTIDAALERQAIRGDEDDGSPLMIFEQIESLAQNHDIRIEYDVKSRLEEGYSSEVAVDGLKYSYTSYITRKKRKDDYKPVISSNSLEEALLYAIKYGNKMVAGEIK